MPDFLLELGCEELPASAVASAAAQLEQGLVEQLRLAALPPTSARRLATPRRLIVGVFGIPPVQPDRTEFKRGPSLAASYDAQGNPTTALLGFCRGQGVAPDDTREDGGYVSVEKQIRGESAGAVLAQLCPSVIRGLAFEKTMRWGSGRMRFARPIRWIVALLDGQIVPFEVGGVASGSRSRGHRFSSPEEFEAGSFESLCRELQTRFVEPDPETRRQRILEEARRVASGTPDLEEALVDENVFLTEWPEALAGEFPEAYLELPEPVLVTAMAKHERFFPVREASGRLTNQFVSVRNGGDEDTVRQGNRWVLEARFNDARFFYEQDRRLTMEDLLARTDGIVFQEKLGSLRLRTQRLERLLADFVPEGAELATVQQAARYSKADTASSLVAELTSLQGVIGGVYARQSGFPEDVAFAIENQYRWNPKNAPKTPAERAAARLVVADHTERLASYLGLGLAPSGSSDPNGLRRSATALIELSWAWEGFPEVADLLPAAASLLAEQGLPCDEASMLDAAATLFASRYEALLSDARHDLLDAAAFGEFRLRPRDVRFRLAAMELAARDVALVQTATRPANIVEAARAKGILMATGELDSVSGDELAAHVAQAKPKVLAAADARNAEALVSALKALAPAVDAFFEGTMVMVDDEQLRAARLDLLASAAALFAVAGDFGSVVVEG